VLQGFKSNANIYSLGDALPESTGFKINGVVSKHVRFGIDSDTAYQFY